MIRTLPLTFATVLFALLSVQACAPVGLVMGAGATAGMAAYQERGVEGVARDMRTAANIFELFGRSNHFLIKNIGVEVYEGRVLLTGQVPNETERAEAVRLAWTAVDVKDVINEIHVTQDGNLLDTARDTWITAQLETKMTFDDRIFAVNYSIETVGGTVYLIGIAQSQQELDRVMNQARAIPYVNRIISHVRIKDPQPESQSG
jgi:osmotically-inducible protein OsmY